MSHEVTVRLRGTLKTAYAQALLMFCEDWSFAKVMQAPPADPLLREAHDALEPFFADQAHDPVLHDALRDNSLDLDTVLQHGPGPLAFLVDRFLPQALEALDEGWYAFGEERQGGSRTNLVFDRDTRVLTRKVGKQPKKPGQKPSKEAAWLAGHGNLPAERWRKALAWLLALTADPVRLAAAFRGKVSGPVGDWLDLSDFYCTELNLEKGLEAAKRTGYLTAMEEAMLHGFDSAFRNYVPDDFDDSPAILRDSAWAEVTELAQDASAGLGPALRGETEPV